MKKILIIDDDHVSVFLIKKIISRISFAIPVANSINGVDAIGFLKNYFESARSLPDFILLDLNMPIMNGFEFLEAFGSLVIPGIHQVKVIVVSSTINDREISKALALGAHHFLSKPLEEESLRAALNE